MSDLEGQGGPAANAIADRVDGPNARSQAEVPASGVACARPAIHLPGLDGLRALAVIAVLLYHAEVPPVAGGYLGVEVFFVLSGYLITALLMAEAERSSGHIDLKRFWMRRARRLLPAVFCMVGVVVVSAVLFLAEEVAELRGQVAAALVYGTNWYFILSEQSYFETLGRPPLLQHLWSLAVEEQFYLAWPLLFAIAVRRMKRPGLAAACLLAALCSAIHAWLLYVPDADPSRLYYGTDTRASGLLVGAALAFGWTPSQRVADRSRLGLDAVGALALIALALQMATTAEADPFLYRGKLMLCAMTTAVIIAVAVHPSARLGRLLDAAPLRFIGVRSYSLYLWHWPVFMVTRPELDVPLDGGWLLLLRLAITCALAELSFRCIEIPARGGAIGRAAGTLRAALHPWQHHPYRGIAGTGATAGTITLAAVCLATTVWLGIAVANAKPPALPEGLVVSIPLEAQRPSSGRDAPAPRAPAASERTQTPGPMPVPAATPTPVAAATPTPVATESPGISSPERQVLALGDSVMLGAAQELKAALGPGATIDARVGRQVVTGIKILRALEAAGRLGDTVLLHLGNNGTFTPGQFDEIMTVLGPERTAIFVTVKVPRRWQASVNETLRTSVKRYRHALLVDWNRYSTSLRRAFGPDGVHLRDTGRRAYAEYIRQRISAREQVRDGASPTP